MITTRQKCVQLRPVDLSDATAIQRWYAEPQVVEYAIIRPFLGYSHGKIFSGTAFPHAP